MVGYRRRTTISSSGMPASGLRAAAEVTSCPNPVLLAITGNIRTQALRQVTRLG